MKKSKYTNAAIIFYVLLLTAMSIFSTIKFNEVSRNLSMMEKRSLEKDSIILELNSRLNAREYKEYLVWKEVELKHFKNFTELPDSIFNLIFQQADSNCVPLPIFLGVIDRESGFKFIPNSEGSGAMGYMQLMPKTFNSIANKLGLVGGHTPMNNIRAGAFYLRVNYQYWFNRIKDDESAWRHALAEYAVGRGGMQVFAQDSSISYQIPDKAVHGIEKVMKNYNK